MRRWQWPWCQVLVLVRVADVGEAKSVCKSCKIARSKHLRAGHGPLRNRPIRGVLRYGPPSALAQLVCAQVTVLRYSVFMGSCKVVTSAGAHTHLAGTCGAFQTAVLAHTPGGHVWSLSNGCAHTPGRHVAHLQPLPLLCVVHQWWCANAQRLVYAEYQSGSLVKPQQHTLAIHPPHHYICNNNNNLPNNHQT